jgi:hypothetical protein
MAGGTQGLVAAAQAAMDEAVRRFAPYAESGVPESGGESSPFGGLDPIGMATLNMFPYQVFGGFDASLVHELQYRHRSGAVTRKANRCAMRVARSS